MIQRTPRATRTDTLFAYTRRVRSCKGTPRRAPEEGGTMKSESGPTTAGIIGLGYVGIPLAISMHDAGLKVIGFDVDQDRIASLNQGKSPLTHIGDAAITALVGGGFEATDDFSRAAECDALVICVPTPLSKMQEQDLQFVTATMDALAPHLRAGQLLSLESTTWPGRSEEHTSELQSLMRISYAVFGLKKKKLRKTINKQ